jgi:hypothetical protein
VKFLAPDDDQDEDDGMSEQSSICQSPSWEGYGQRKKEKKLEAERRRREKEQAEKDAKAAKKRNTARLSKVPPHPVTATRNSRLAGLTAADRSMSYPLLVTRHLQQSAQSIRGPEEVGRTASADDLQQSRWHRPAVTEVLSGSDSNSRREEGVAIDEPSPSAIPHHLLCDSEFVSLHDLHRTISEGPEIPTHHPSSAFPPRHDSRSPRAAAFPPSASRTPRLRHMSPSAVNRSNGLFQVAPNADHSQESLSAAATADGARRNGYVVQQRAQVAERALAGLADEQLVGNVGQYYPPSRSSSGQTQHTRRPSLTHEAKSVAMKLVGMKTPSSARDSASQTDYLTFKAIPYSSSGSGADASGSSMPASPQSVEGSFQTLVDARPSTSGVPIRRTANELHETSATLERPTTSQSSLSSSGPSIIGSAPGSQGKMTRSLKDAAKAALAISKGPQKPVKPADNTSTSVSLPPFLALRARLQSRTSVHTENKTSQAVNCAPDLASVCIFLSYVACRWPGVTLLTRTSTLAQQRRFVKQPGQRTCRRKNITGRLKALRRPRPSKMDHLFRRPRRHQTPRGRSRRRIFRWPRPSPRRGRLNLPGCWMTNGRFANLWVRANQVRLVLATRKHARASRSGMRTGGVGQPCRSTSTAMLSPS